MRRTFKAIKEEFRFRKAVALLLLIAAGAFLVLNTDSLYYTAKRFYTNSVSSSKELYKGIEEDADSEEDLNYVKLADGVQVTQTFTAEESKIQDLRLLFKNEKYYEADGEVTISLEDSDGENIASSSFKANQIRNKRFLVSSFAFSVDQSPAWLSRNSKPSWPFSVSSNAVTPWAMACMETGGPMATHFALSIFSMTSFATITPRFQLLLLMPAVWGLSGPMFICTP